MVWHGVHEAVWLRKLSRLRAVLRSDVNAIHARSAYGCTPLMVAAGEGLLPFVDALLGAGAPCDVRDQQGKKCVCLCSLGWTGMNVAESTDAPHSDIHPIQPSIHRSVNRRKKNRPERPVAGGGARPHGRGAAAVAGGE